MTSHSKIKFRPYSYRDRAACLQIFDANCPDFFAPNELTDFEQYLAGIPAAYRVCVHQHNIVGAFGAELDQGHNRGRITWIMIEPSAQGSGVGSQMMNYALEILRQYKVSNADIAASHKLAAFFKRYGAIELQRISDGWGPGMDRVDMELAL